MKNISIGGLLIAGGVCLYLLNKQEEVDAPKISEIERRVDGREEKAIVMQTTKTKNEDIERKKVIPVKELNELEVKILNISPEELKRSQVHLKSVEKRQGNRKEGTLDSENNLFRFEELSNGDYTIVIQTPTGFLTDRVEMRKERVTKRYNVDRGEFVYGRVIDESTQRPIEGVKVRLRNEVHDPIIVDTATDKDGFFNANIHAQGTYQVVSKARGYLLDVMYRKCPREIKDIRIPLRGAMKLEGMIVGEHGKSVDAEIKIIEGNGEEYREGFYRIEKKETGSFFVEELERRPLMIVIENKQYGKKLMMVDPRKSQKVEVTLKPGMNIGGFVWNDAGRAVEGAKVTLQRQIVSSPITDIIVHTGSTGSYAITNVEEDTYKIRVDHPSYLSTESEMNVLENRVIRDFRIRRKN